ncbi:PHP domain-containing protein [Nanoarchaeota archaeon]
MNLLDLHIHTTESDGELTPAGLVEYAQSQGVSIIAKTDHNSIDGNEEAVEKGKEIDVSVIPGCELSVEDDFEGQRTKNHLHAYSMDPSKISPELHDFFRRDAITKNNQAENVARLAQQNPIELTDGTIIKPSFDDIRTFVASDKVVHWGEFGAYIADKINMLYNQRNNTEGEILIGMYQALALFLNGDERYIAEYKERLAPYINSEIGNVGWKASYDKELKATLMIEDALKFVIEAGGAPVIAHPGEKNRLMKAETLEEKYKADERYLRHLQKLGLQGLEVYSPKNSPEQTSAYHEIAKKIGLLISAGTDFHGANYSPDKQLGYRTKKGAENMIPFPFEEVKPMIDILLR